MTIAITILVIYLIGFYAQGFMAFKISAKNPKSDYRSDGGESPEYFVVAVTSVFWPLFFLPSTLILMGLSMESSERKKK